MQRRAKGESTGPQTIVAQGTTNPLTAPTPMPNVADARAPLTMPSQAPTMPTQPTQPAQPGGNNTAKVADMLMAFVRKAVL